LKCATITYTAILKIYFLIPAHAEFATVKEPLGLVIQKKIVKRHKTTQWGLVRVDEIASPLLQVERLLQDLIL